MNVKRPEIEWDMPKCVNAIYEKRIKRKKTYRDFLEPWKIFLFLIIVIFPMILWLLRDPSEKRNLQLYELIVILLIAYIVTIVFFKIIHLIIPTKVKFYDQKIMIGYGSDYAHIKYIQIKTCNFFLVEYKEKHYKAFELKDENNILGFIILSEDIPSEKIIDFFEKKGIKCNRDIHAII